MRGRLRYGDKALCLPCPADRPEAVGAGDQQCLVFAICRYHCIGIDLDLHERAQHRLVTQPGKTMCKA
jgi:hypothetical protein